MSGAAWVVTGIIVWACVCLFGCALAGASKSRGNAAKRSDDDYEKRMTRYRENQWP